MSEIAVHQNKLANSRSAYLKSAAHQPIDWYEYGDEAFAAAAAEDKPVLIDIGAAWCHWCHVIDRESYENAAIAELINQRYIAVKIDRDERPDLDARYQHLVAQISGRGGWPLTVFLTPDGRLLYGGTYFPPDHMKALLNRVAELYQEKKPELKQQQAAIDAALSDDEAAAHEHAPQADMPTLAPSEAQAFVQRVLADCQQKYDPVHGGFGQAPKFPHWSALRLMLAAENKSLDLNTALEKTLTTMARGGIYDQVAGGFHRYSVDERWHVPHFEKMAYDNAEALLVYAEATRQQNNPLYLQTLTSTLDWVLRDLYKDGQFATSQDADIDLDDDGDHFTWTLAELEDALGKDDAAFAAKLWGVTKAGDMHERPGRNVLEVVDPQLADTEPERLERIKSTLLDTRLNKRPIPFIDRCSYTNWAAMLVTGCLRAASVLQRPDAAKLALTALDQLLQDAWQAETGLTHAPGVPAMLDDAAWLITALLEAERYLSLAGTDAGSSQIDPLLMARNVADWTLDHFEDKREGGFFDIAQTGDNTGILAMPRKPVEDTPTSSANATLMLALQQLAAATDDTRYQTAAHRAASYFAPRCQNHGMYAAALGLALQQQASPAPVHSVGSDAPADACQRLAQRAPAQAVITRAKPEQPQTGILACENQSCQLIEL